MSDLAGIIDHVGLERECDGEPGDADKEEAQEAGFVGVAVREEGGEVAAVAVQAV